jgi:hypothetical protein
MRSCLCINCTNGSDQQPALDGNHSLVPGRRASVPYKVRNPDAAGALKNWIEKNKTEAGQDLVALSGNSEFLYALGNSPFFKQDFDEALQFSRPSVIFGFRDVPSSALRRPQFLLIRFPAELLAILQFEPVTPAVAR